MARQQSCALVAIVILLSSGSVHAQDVAGKKLFNGKDLTGWSTFVDPKRKAKGEDIWSVKDGVIHCTGAIRGYIITKESYGDYVLKLQWKWGKKPARKRNSGVILHITGENKIWPKGAEAQLMAGNAGDIWLIGGFQLAVDPAQQDKKIKRHYYRTEKSRVEKEFGQWNQYEIICKGDTITLKINGKQVNQGKKSELSKGRIALQSEGAEIFFRNIELTPIK